MNNVVHNCVEELKPKILKLGDNREKIVEKIIDSISRYIERLIQVVSPKKEVYLAFDGRSPTMKLVETMIRRTSKKKFLDNFDKNLISLLIGKLIAQMKLDFVEFYCSTKSIIVSGEDEEGEGEVKIMQRIKQKELEEEKILIFSNDSDFFLYTLKESGFSNTLIVLPKRFFNLSLTTVFSVRTIRLYFNKR